MTQRIKILIIDDDDADRKSITRAVKASGFNADMFTATDIETGIALTHEASFDCIFLDYYMPGNNGFEFLKMHLQSNNPSPVIMVTGHGDETLAVQAMKLGACDYISKNNISPESLAQLIRHALRLKEATVHAHKIESSLAESENKLEAVLFNSGIIFFTLNSDGIFTEVRCNQSYSHFIDAGSIKGKSIFELNGLSPISLKDFKCALEGQSVIAENDESRFPFRIQLIPINDNDGKISGVACIALDNSASVSKEANLKNSLEMAVENQKMKDAFLANMSHEIRTPIHGIMSLTDILLKTTLNEEQQKFLNAIKNSADNLLVIINDILDLSKIESGKLKIESAPFCPSETIHSVFDLFKSLADEKGLQFHVTIDDSIPEILLGDAVRLSQVLSNLVNNAIKFTEKGFVKIYVYAEEANNKFMMIAFRVSDSGIGIPAHKLNDIFNTFEQAGDDITRKYGGSGLGLTICKKLTEMQGGMIYAESNIGHGSVFTFKIPYQIQNADQENLSPGTTSTNTTVPSRPMHLLIVEDNDVNKMVISKFVRDRGYTFDTAANGEAALECLAQHSYDAVLLDIEMPGMNGYETLRQFNNLETNLHAKRPYFIAITAHANDEERQKCMDAGMDDYLSKPFRQEALYEKIEKAAPIKSSRSVTSNIDHPGNTRLTNLNYLRELSENNDDFFRDFISLFLKNAPVSISDMEQSAAVEDWDRVRQAAHKLKPSLSYLGMKELHQLALAIEENAKMKNNVENIPSMIQTIKEGCSQAFMELESELKSLTPLN